MYAGDRFFVAIAVRGEERGNEERLVMVHEVGHPTVQIMMDHISDIEKEFFAWEVAVACAAIVLEANPFDQPDVRSSKELTRRVLEGAGGDAALMTHE